MRINVPSLMANLPEQQPYLQEYTPGLFRAIDAAHYQTKSNEVDWNSFTLKEAEQALEMAMAYVDQEYMNDVDEEGLGPNEGNAIHEFIHNSEAIYSVKSIKPETQTQNVDFF
jgi:hypothetical protein